ncbi:hypothetical protein DPMN_146982 [Dreissena polymorpha]|uniref:Uncharacterized protein n=1 Tax=Dreissena polymorpha TaxID=45954 RepID=A0A9D4F8Z4_DREPO|nr:hypothetical protein DPMN_146982 [Dreissena polymorpha]
MPVFLKPELLEEVFDVAEPVSSAIYHLRQSLNVLGLFDLFGGLPELKYLLSPSNVPLTMKRVLHMLKPLFFEERSNANRYVKDVYQMFIKYFRELSGTTMAGMSWKKREHYSC